MFEPPPDHWALPEVGRELDFDDPENLGDDGWNAVHGKSVRMNFRGVKLVASNRRIFCEQLPSGIRILLDLNAECV